MTDPADLIRDETGTQRMLGYTLDVGQPDRRARCRLIVDDRHTNRHGVLHGGIAATLLDSAAGATASLTVDDRGRRPFLTVSLSIDFIRPARRGGVTATGRIVGGGRSLLFVAAELVQDDGTLIATASGVFKPVTDPPRTDRATPRAPRGAPEPDPAIPAAPGGEGTRQGAGITDRRDRQEIDR